MTAGSFFCPYIGRYADFYARCSLPDTLMTVHAGQDPANSKVTAFGYYYYSNQIWLLSNNASFNHKITVSD